MTRAATYSNPENIRKIVKGYISASEPALKAIIHVTKISTGTVVMAADEIRQSRDSVWDGK